MTDILKIAAVAISAALCAAVVKKQVRELALVLAPVVKTVGVAIITRVTVEVCKDAGEGGIAAFVEIAGSAVALYLALPLVRAVLSAITGLL